MVSTIADDSRQGCFQMAVGAVSKDSAVDAPLTGPAPQLTRQGAHGRRRIARRPSDRSGCRWRIADSLGKENLGLLFVVPDIPLLDRKSWPVPFFTYFNVHFRRKSDMNGDCHYGESRNPENQEPGSGIKEKKPFSFPINPIAWAKLPPDPERTAGEVWSYDMANAFCILNPIFLLFFSMIDWFTSIRIPEAVFTYFDPLLGIFFMGIHYWMIKCYPFLVKMNKFAALLSVKIIPIYIIVGMWAKMIAAK